MNARLVVLVSGEGTNLQTIIRACSQGELEAQVVAVVSNRVAAKGLSRADKADIPTELVVPSGEERDVYDTNLARVVARYQPDLVVLAGWMRILSNSFLSQFRVINLHPAMPGQFPGTRAIERAFAAWQAGEIEQSGVMVHWVPDEGIDDGPVIVHSSVPFHSGDTVATFESRVHAVEHQLVVKGIALAWQETQARHEMSGRASP